MDKGKILMTIDEATVTPLQGSIYVEEKTFIPITIPPARPIKLVYEGDVLEFIDDDAIIFTYQTNLLNEKMAVCDVSHLTEEEIDKYLALINGVKGYWRLEQDE